MKDQLLDVLTTIANTLKNENVLKIDAIPPIQLDRTRDPAHGDLACNMALILAKSARMNPRDLAQHIVARLPGLEWIEKTEIAGPGFINFFLRSDAAHTVIPQILNQADQYGHNTTGQGIRVQIEFVSANPTGPLHVGHGRGAAYGASLANLLIINGYDIHREYYVNDAGRQMDILAVSVWLRYLELAGETLPFPANGYQGDYIWDIGASLHREHGDRFRHPATIILDGLPADESGGGDKEHYIDTLIERGKILLGEDLYRKIHAQGLLAITDNIRHDLKEFGVEYDEWFLESTLMQTDAVSDGIKRLQKNDTVYEKDGALWFRSTDYGDEKDRVIQRDNGAYTYFASDIAYHTNKLSRGFDRLINIWGADHHGYIARVKAALDALGAKPEQLEIMLVQFATLYRDKQQIRMTTRGGQFITLRELRYDTGNDAARFFYVMRKPEQHLNFDLNLAKSRSNDNPVYYIQYAHARISSVFRQLSEHNLQWDKDNGIAALNRLTEDHEQALVKMLNRYAEMIEQAGQQYEPHQITYYLRELAQALHAYYNAHKFIVEDKNLRDARLCLIHATRQIIRNGLNIIGVSAPDEMHHDTD